MKQHHLVATKWSLPSILRNSVPKLRITDDVRPLVITNDKLWGALHRQAEKTTTYDGQRAVFLTVHETLRLLQLEDGQKIWVPRATRANGIFAEERIRQQLTSGVRQAYPRVCFTGEARPQNYVTVPLESLYAEIPQDTVRFLRPLGAPETYLTYTSSSLTSLMSLHTRLANLREGLDMLLEVKKQEFYQQVVIEHLRKSQMGAKRISAVYDVLVEGLPVEKVAEDRGIRLRDLRQVVGRVGRAVYTVVVERLDQARAEMQPAYASNVAQIKEEAGMPEAA